MSSDKNSKDGDTDKECWKEINKNKKGRKSNKK